MSKALVDNVFKIVDWFRFKRPGVTQMKVMKLLYYVQGISLAICGRPAFDDDIVAWKYGPAVPSVHEKYRGYVELPAIESDDRRVRKDLEDVQRIKPLFYIVNSVNNKYGRLTAINLMLQTHEEAPWRHTPQSHVISKDVIKEYFRNHVVTRN